jgi:hypothetical protein
MFLIDPDTIESSNLNRTPFRLCDIGQAKVDALKHIILERRAVAIHTYQQKTDSALYEEIKSQTFGNGYKYRHNPRDLNRDGVIIDCRDDVYTDFYEAPYKYYKVGYDGTGITCDGNPRNTAVWGQSNGYRFTPSFVCSAQLAANLIVSDILIHKLTSEESSSKEIDTIDNNNPFDNERRLNKAVTFDCKEVMEILYREMQSRET